MDFIPYGGGHPAFKIGLKPLAVENWIHVDDQLSRYLEEKERLYAKHPELVFLAKEDSLGGQQEVLDLLADHLPRTFPDSYRRDDGKMLVAGREVDLKKTALPLLTAARLVQEDLLLMRWSEQGWYLAAGSLCFPSSWSLQEKFGNPLHIIHKPVPQFGSGSRNAVLIERIFDNLQVDQPVWRMNWSIYDDDDLYHPTRHTEGFRQGGDALAKFIRVEYQTLRKLPVSGDILFTVRILINPLEHIAELPDCCGICEGFIRLLLALDAEQLAYKGLTDGRDQLVERLREMAVGNG